MAGSVNKVILLGNLGADPDIKTFSNGGRIANLRVATSESWKDKNTGEKREKTEWTSVTLNSDGLVGVAERFLKKGSKVYIEGKLQTRKWQDQSGNDRYSTEVVVSGYGGSLVMLDGPGGGRGGGNSGSKNSQGSFSDGGSSGAGGGGGWSGSSGGQSGGSWNQGGADDFDDDVPF